MNSVFCIRLMLAGLLAWAVGASADGGKQRQFTFAWPYAESGEMKPRGGTSKGPDVTLVAEPTDAWQAIQAPDIGKVERDRRAILAMAGAYRTSFDFIETAGFHTRVRAEPAISILGHRIYLRGGEAR
ncbi:MAG: hypothetical protein U5O39_14785 [Gammaproteobacteria bacterium]|nr:hypothetical protein [Gammaproteobacteria bacterium]